MSTNSENVIKDWLLHLPLYSPSKVGISQIAAREMHLYDGKFDTYCPECKQNATFKAHLTESGKLRLNTHNAGGSVTWPESYIYKIATCTRLNHQLEFIFKIINSEIIKIGQFPSLADMATSDTVQFRPVLSKGQLNELNKGIGLAAHGVGVGSYVYLRRVFELLIEDAHHIAQSDKEWNEEEYLQSRMKEKIQLLAQHLPMFLVKHPALYGLLSKGIHELTEEECLADFDKLKNAIFVICEEKLSEHNRKKRIEEASKSLQS